MSRVRSHAADERGAVLVLVLTFVVFVGLLAAATGRYATSNVRSTVSLRNLRADQFAADGAVDAAIANGRLQSSTNTTWYNQAFTLTLNGQTFRVDRSGTANTDVTFKAYRNGTSTNPVLTAEAFYDWTTSPPAVEIHRWSVNK